MTDSPANPFDNDEQVQDIISAIVNAHEPEDAAQALQAASGLAPAAQVYVADKLEESLVSVIVNDMLSEPQEARQMAAYMAAARKGNNPELLARIEGEVGTTFVALSDTLAFIAQNKGEAASPFVKAYVEEAAKLTDEQYNLPECQITALCAAADKVNGVKPAAPKANPFRPKGPGL